MSHPFTWKALQAQLAASPHLEATDDLSTQRGLLATSDAILQRMLRHGLNIPVVPVSHTAPPPAERPAPLVRSSVERPNAGALPVAPAPAPIAPRPSGAAVRLPRAPALEISF